MKKLFTLLTFALTLGFFSQMTAQELVSTDPQNRVAIMEEFTGIYCGYCPQGHAIVNKLMADNPGQIYGINIHEGGYAVPQAGSGHPDFRTQWGAAIMGQTGLTGFPMGSVSRQVFKDNKTAMSRGDWETYSNQVMGQVSPVNVGAKATWISNKTLQIDVEIYFTDDAPANNLLNIAVLESGVYGYQSGGSDNYEHQHNHRGRREGRN